MRFEAFDDSVTNSRHALERFERTEGTTTIPIGYDALRERGADPRQPFDRCGIGDVEIDRVATGITFRG